MVQCVVRPTSMWPHSRTPLCRTGKAKNYRGGARMPFTSDGSPSSGPAMHGCGATLRQRDLLQGKRDQQPRPHVPSELGAPPAPASSEYGYFPSPTSRVASPANEHAERMPRGSHLTRPFGCPFRRALRRTTCTRALTGKLPRYFISIFTVAGCQKAITQTTFA